jgi:transposase
MLSGMNAYSNDLRLRVLAAAKRGSPRTEIADLFGVSLLTTGRYIERKVRGEDIAPRPSPGRRAKVLDGSENRKAPWEQLRENDAATPAEHCRIRQELRGIAVSVATMSCAVRKLGWSGKRDYWEPPSAMSKREAPLESM